MMLGGDGGPLKPGFGLSGDFVYAVVTPPRNSHSLSDVILSGVRIPRRGIRAQSKDPYTLSNLRIGLKEFSR